MLAHLGQVYTTSVFLFSPSFLCFSPAEAEIFPPFSLASFYRGVVRTLFFLNQFAEAPSPPLSQPRLGGALRAYRRPPQSARPPMLVARRAEVALIKGRCVACGLASPCEAMPRSRLSRKEPLRNAVRAKPRAQRGSGERRGPAEGAAAPPSIAPRGNRVRPGAARGALPSYSPHPPRSQARTRGPSPNEIH